MALNLLLLACILTVMAASAQDETNFDSSKLSEIYEEQNDSNNRSLKQKCLLSPEESCVFTSPEFPSPFPCGQKKYVIKSSDPRCNIKIECCHFQLPSVSRAYLYITWGQEAQARKFYGSSLPPTILSTSNYVYAFFLSKHWLNTSYRGFNCTASTICPTTTMVAPISAVETTAAPTTAAPTTAAPTTAAPTTMSPTNPVPRMNFLSGLLAAPTTMAPTTAALTTAAPTSACPTTASSTTAAPTTAAPTSAGPTTASSTTAAPTTAAPTAAAPTTAAPITADPPSAVPTTAAPTTTDQTTAAPTISAPAPAAQTTAAPSTMVLTTAVQTTEAPTTAAPTTMAPINAAPTTETPYLPCNWCH